MKKLFFAAIAAIVMVSVSNAFAGKNMNGGMAAMAADTLTADTVAPAAEQPATEAPAAEQPATEAPAVEQPATDTPAVEAPAAEAPAAADSTAGQNEY